MKKGKGIIQIPVITLLIFVMLFFTMVSAYPLQEDLETLYEKRGGTYITLTYYDDTFIDAISSSINEVDGNINIQKIYRLLDPVSFHPQPWLYGQITPGVVELSGSIYGENHDKAFDMGTTTKANIEPHSEHIIFREGPANGYKEIATLEHNQKGREKYRVMDEINNYLFVKTETLEGWVEKSQVQRQVIMEPLSLDFIRVTHNQVNFRQGPSTSEELLGQVDAGEVYRVLEVDEDWLKIQKDHQTGWIYQNYTEKEEMEIPEEWYHFLQIHDGVPAGILEEEINQLLHSFLSEQGFFEEIGEAFLEAGQVTELNEVYLLALAMKQYNESTEIFYEGVVVDQVAGSVVEPRTVYNFYGIGAVGREPQRTAGETAYMKGWFTPKTAIVDGARWILKNEFQGEADTLYKRVVKSYMNLMDSAMVEGEVDVTQDFKLLSQEIIESIEIELEEDRAIAIDIKKIYDEFDLENQRFIIPVFDKQWYWPVPGFWRISSDFGWRKDPFEGDIRFHGAIDIPAPTGTPIVAVKSGVVTKIFRGESYGNFIEIDHGQGITTRYAHNAENYPKIGDFVEKGELIATVGSTGRSTGPHLHFELRLNNQALDPLPWLTEEN